jgi:hypothetical protein
MEPLEQHPLPPKKRRHNKRIDFLISLIVNIIALYIINNLLDWEVQFINWKWPQVLGILNTSIIVTIVFYAAFIIYSGKLFYLLGRTIMDIIAIVATYRLYSVFPFDFNGFFEMGWLNAWFPYLLLLGMVGLTIGIIVRAARFMTNKNIYY